MASASPDLLQAMMQDFAEVPMTADADALCGAGHGEGPRSGSTAATAIANVTGTRAWLLEPRRRAVQAFCSVIADCYFAGVYTRRVEKLARLGIEHMSKSRVSCCVVHAAAVKPGQLARVA